MKINHFRGWLSGISAKTSSLVAALYEANIWPTQHVPALESAFKGLGQLIVQVAAALVTHCDRLVVDAASQRADDATTSQAPVTAGPGQMTMTIAQSRCTKGRLLNYSPVPEGSGGQTWCGWHTDHGLLTGNIPSF